MCAYAATYNAFENALNTLKRFGVEIATRFLDNLNNEH